MGAHSSTLQYQQYLIHYSSTGYRWGLAYTRRIPSQPIRLRWQCQKRNIISFQDKFQKWFWMTQSEMQAALITKSAGLTAFNCVIYFTVMSEWLTWSRFYSVTQTGLFSLYLQGSRKHFLLKIQQCLIVIINRCRCKIMNAKIQKEWNLIDLK